MALNTSQNEKGTDTANNSAVFDVIARIIRWLGIAMIIGGAFISSDSFYPLLPTSYTTVLAGGAVVLAVSLFFQIEGIKQREK